MRIAPFSCDATPPIGHPLCGGWITPAKEIVTRQYLHGVLIELDDAEPVVLCAVDWCWIRGEAYQNWREHIAHAVQTSANRVSIHCVHQHDALMADTGADAVLAKVPLDLRTLKGPFFEQTVARSAEEAGKARVRLRRVTHIGAGEARVEKVASNRRLIGPDGKVKFARLSSCKTPEARAQPEGLIDPWLKCVSFYDGDECLAALHYYATHPMSYYGQGGVSGDFVGIARERLRDEQKAHHVYFTGCAGNVAAGKYNDGSHENRPVLAERIYTGMKSAIAATRRFEPGKVTWSSQDMKLPMNPQLPRAFFEKQMGNEKGSNSERIRGAMGLAWWDWTDAGKTVDASALHIGDIHLLNLPSEVFIEYQLYAQQLAANLTQARPPVSAGGKGLDAHFVAVAAYGDCGPSYIPIDEAYPQGGYEVSMAWVGPGSEAVLKNAIRDLLRQGAG